MFPGPNLSKTHHEGHDSSSDGKGLSRLAEIADVVSRHEDEMVQPPNTDTRNGAFSSGGSNSHRANGGETGFVGERQGVSLGPQAIQKKPKRNPFEAVSAALRKRPYGGSSLTSMNGEISSSKRARINTIDMNPDTTSITVTNDLEGEAPTAPSGLVGTSADDIAAVEEEAKGVRFREYQAEIWSEKFEDLCEFRRRHGHCHVPHTFMENAALAQWVKRQRYQYKLKSEGKRSTLSDERVRLLNKIGFIWNSHDVVWEERLNELSMYKRHHGNCIVPSNYERNPQLAVWVKRQRRQYKFYQENKPTSMTPERIAKLNRIGFAWDCRKKDLGKGHVGNSMQSDGSDEEMPVSMMAAAAAGKPVASKVSRMRLSGGFPMPASKGMLNNTSIGTFRKQMTGLEPSSSLPEPGSLAVSQKSTKSRGQGDSKVSTNGLPCEFFSFSRKFTKFPKISLPK